MKKVTEEMRREIQFSMSHLHDLIYKAHTYNIESKNAAMRIGEQIDDMEKRHAKLWDFLNSVFEDEEEAVSDGEKERPEKGVYKTPTLHAMCKRCKEAARVSRRVDTYVIGGSKDSHSPPILIVMCGCRQHVFRYVTEVHLLQAVESGEFLKDVLKGDWLEEAE